MLRREFVLVRHRQEEVPLRLRWVREDRARARQARSRRPPSIDVAVHVAVMKYLDHHPLERMVRSFARDGNYRDEPVALGLCSDQVAFVVALAYRRLREYVLSHRGCRRRRRDLRADGRYRPRGEQAVADLDRHRAQRRHLPAARQPRRSVPPRSCSGRHKGILLCDGYGAYARLSRRPLRRSRSPTAGRTCAEIHRDQQSFPEETKQILALIGELYAVERLCPRGPPVRFAASYGRHAHALILAGDRSLGLATYPRLLPESGLAKAIRYGAVRGRASSCS
ncbi:MAG: transposase [Byssovorax sp.]